MENKTDPIDGNTAATLVDPEYFQGRAQYDAAYEALTRGIWVNHYIHRAPPNKL